MPNTTIEIATIEALSAAAPHIPPYQEAVVEIDEFKKSLFARYHEQAKQAALDGLEGRNFDKPEDFTSHKNRLTAAKPGELDVAAFMTPAEIDQFTALTGKAESAAENIRDAVKDVMQARDISTDKPPMDMPSAPVTEHKPNGYGIMNDIVNNAAQEAIATREALSAAAPHIPAYQGAVVEINEFQKSLSARYHEQAKQAALEDLEGRKAVFKPEDFTERKNRLTAAKPGELGVAAFMTPAEIDQFTALSVKAESAAESIRGAVKGVMQAHGISADKPPMDMPSDSITVKKTDGYGIMNDIMNNAAQEAIAKPHAMHTGESPIRASAETIPLKPGAGHAYSGALVDTATGEEVFMPRNRQGETLADIRAGQVSERTGATPSTDTHVEPATREIAPSEHANTATAASKIQVDARGASGAALGVDAVNFVRAAAKGDTEGMLASGGSAAVNSAALTDSMMATAGKSSGNISKALGPIGYVSAAATTGIKLYELETTDAVDKKTQERELVTDTALGIGGGVVGGSLAGAGAVALGATGLIAGAAATGGAVLVGVAAAAAVKYADKAIDKATYGWQDELIKENLENKKNMVSIVGKFHDQLVDKESGKIDWTDQGTINKYMHLLVVEGDKQNKIAKDNSSYLPRYLRSGEGLRVEQEAIAESKRVNLAHDELVAFNNEIKGRGDATSMTKALVNNSKSVIEAKQEKALAKINGLDLNGNKQLDVGDLDRDGDGKLTQKDMDAIEKKIGDYKVFDSLVSTLREHGVTFDNQSVAQVIAQQTPATAQKTDKSSSRNT